RPGREKRDTTFGVDCDLTPGIGAADVFPRIFRPRVVAELSWMWHGVERPDQLSGDDVVGAEISGRRKVGFAGRRTEDHQILEHLARGIRLDAPDFGGIASEILAQIDDTVGAECDDRLAGFRIYLLQIVAEAENEPAIPAVLALPVVHAAAGDAFERFVNPDFLPGAGIERNQRTVSPLRVDHPTRDDWVEHRLAVRIRPGDVESRDVGLVDLLERAELGVVGAAAVVAPFSTALVTGGEHRSREANQDANFSEMNNLPGCRQ